MATDTSCCADLVAEAQPPQPRPQPTPEEALATLRALLSRAEAFVKEAAEEGLATVATPTDEKHGDEALRMARTTSEAYSNNIRAQRMARNTSSKEALPSASIDESLGPIMPQLAQTPGTPYTYYHINSFLETKPTGLRMSACMAIMDECRFESHLLCDNQVVGIPYISDPHIEVAIELMPAILQLSDEKFPDGMLFRGPKSKGAVQSWVRAELTYGFPQFPFKSEMHNLYLVGKHKQSSQRIHICSGRFTEAFVDVVAKELANPKMVQAPIEQFFAKLKQDHSSEDVGKMYPLKKAVEPKGKPFTPTLFKKVSWMMSYNFVDWWGRFYYAKSPEVCWDVNKLAGGKFYALTQDEPDPQSLCVSMVKQMDIGTIFDVLCFLEEESKKAVYVVLAKGGSKAGDVYLQLCANFQWKGCPADGKTLCAEDFEVLAGISRLNLVKYAAGEEFKNTKNLDLTKLPKPRS